MLMLQHLKKVIKPTGQQLEVGGMACDEYTFDLQAPTRPTQGLSSILHDHGTVCVSQIISGGADVANYVHEAKKRGYVSAAAPCSPTPSPIGPSFFGEQTNVLVLSARTESVSETPPGLGLGAMGRVENNTTVTAIRIDLIPEETFQIPADWKVKQEPDYR
jgi:hypothetical protein